MRKRILLAIVFLCLVSQSIAYAAPLGENHWAYPYVNKFLSLGVKQSTDESFVGQDIGRAEFFADAKKFGLPLSDDENSGMSDEPYITREEAFELTAAVLNESPPSANLAAKFKDASKISDPSAVTELVWLGVLDGYTDGTLRPLDNITRAEAYKIFAKAAAVKTAAKTAVDVPVTRVETNDSASLRDYAPGAWASNDGAVAPPAQPPALSFTAETGSSFRSIDVYVTATDASLPYIYYLALDAGSPAPTTAKEIIFTGQGVRGHFAATFGGTVGYTLFGGENVDAYPQAPGFAAGKLYDLYMVATNDDFTAASADIAAQKKIIALPFAARNLSDKTYTIETGEQLANIRLFPQDSGNTFVLANNIDLRAYEAVHGAWTPIGDAASPFTGRFDGNGHSVSGLDIDSASGAQGLFGTIQNAVVRNLTLESPSVIAHGTVSESTAYAGVGALAGESLNSAIENVTVNAPLVDAFATGENSRCALGGAVGSAVNTSFSGVTVTDAKIYNRGGYADVAGGVAGRIYNYSGGERALNDITVSGVIESDGRAAGGVAGTIDSVGFDALNIYAKNISVNAAIGGDAMYVGGAVGNVGFERLLNAATSLTFDNVAASGSVTGSYSVGGLFGKINSSAKDGFVVKNSSAINDIAASSDNAMLGGFVGYVNTGSFEGCTTDGSGITSAGANIGGFAGLAVGDTDFIRCETSRSVLGSDNVGGFAGYLDGTPYFVGCAANGLSVTATSSNAGAFVGFDARK